MPTATPETVHAKLSQLGIEYVNHSHAPVMTVAESQALRGPLSGLHAKNLFLKDKKGGLWLVVVEECRTLDLKALRQRLGVANLSFAKPDVLMAALGVTPGSVTPFAVINDDARRVRVVLDKALAEAEQANFHPLDNANTTTVSGAGLLIFLNALGHAPLVLDFTSPQSPPSSPGAREQ